LNENLQLARLNCNESFDDMKNNEDYFIEFDKLATRTDFRREFFQLRGEIKNINQKLNLILQTLEQVQSLMYKETSS